FLFSSRRRHTTSKRDWSSDVCSSALLLVVFVGGHFLGCFSRSFDCYFISFSLLITCVFVTSRYVITVIDVCSCLDWLLFALFDNVVNIIGRSSGLFNLGVDVWIEFVLRH